MKRRDFITLLGGAAAAWPLAMRAQQGERMRRVGVLMHTTSEEPRFAGQGRSASEGASGGRLGHRAQSARRRALERRRRRALARGSLRTRRTRHRRDRGRCWPDYADPAADGPHRSVVMAQVIDPVGGAFVQSMARPGGNVTGFNQFEYSLSGKWLELLREVAPQV